MKSLHFCKPLQQYLPLYLPDYKLFTNLKQANLHMRRQLLISLLLLFLVARSAMAQTFPVQASTNIVPPYSTLLADYVAPGSQRLALNIFLADLNRPQLQTRLRLRIEGEGISITTRPSFMPTPLILQGGIPERLTGTDLAEYFLPQNLDFTGITRRQFESTGKLPEGLYRFCFEILEYNRGVKVSNAACTMAWLILNDPPLINWPDQGEKLTPQDPQYITFQWTPRHTGSPNSAFTTEYDFALVELWPANRNPNDAILTTPPIFETTTQSTTLIYGPEATPLVPGRSYAFRVRARAIIGTESYDLFKNQGYSEAIGFVYGDACTLPTNINARATSGERFNISWEPATVHTNFNVRYRPAIRTADQWYEETTFLQNLDIGGLMAETTYEYQVAAGCGPFLSEYSDIASVTTESRPPVNYTCGLPPEEYSFENREPLPQLNVDDVVLAGDFEVRMMEVSGSNGNFSGKGRALVPYLDNMLVVVEFDQVSVNTDYRMTGGQMDVKGFGADILPDEVNDFLDELDESLDAIENTLDDIATGLDVADSIADQVQDLANDILDDGPLTIEDEERLDAATVAMYLEGAQQAAGAAAGALAAALTPESIETAAREVARAMELTKRGKRLRQIHDNADTLDAIAVEFFASENYGFDISRYRQHRLHYNIMVTADDETHRIPWVATAAGQQETVSARLTGNTGTDAADVAFESDGTALQATMTGDTWSITLPAMEAGAQRSIVALSSTTGATLGKLDAIAYEPIGRKVNLVPVGSTPAGLNAGDILTALNNTYRQAVASWEVAVLDPLKVDGYTGTLQDDEQALLSVYSTGMREIIRAFEATGAVNEDEFYLFLVDRSQVGNTGYMPRKHRYGFIYMEDNPDVSRTVAHELGHGAFRLQHTFEEYPTIGGPRSTANLMDYGTGTKLRKYQWDLIHNPPLVIGLLEDEGEGAYVAMSPEEFDMFYNSVEASMTDAESELRKTAEAIKKIFEFWELCNNQNWKSYDGQGIVPYCLWKESKSKNIPFAAGVVDGAYLEYQGITQLVPIIEEIHDNVGKVIAAYTIDEWKYRPNKQAANKIEYIRVLERLKELEGEDGLWSWVSEKWHQSSQDDLDQYFLERDEHLEFKEKVEEIVEFMTDWPKVLDLVIEISEQVNTYLETLQSDQNEGYYERGRLVIPALTILIDGVGAFSKMPKVKKVFQGMKKFIDEGKWGTFTKTLKVVDDLPSPVRDRISTLSNEQKALFFEDLDRVPDLVNYFDEVDKVDSWSSFKKVGLDDLAKNPVQLQKFDDLVKSNNLGLDAKGLEDLLSAPKAKGLTWDNPDGVLDAVKRASDGNISDLSISHKKFPESGSDNFVLRNAKQYQAEASGDAALCFNKGGVSFDDIAPDGKLVDRKYGHSSSIFDKVDDGFETVYEVVNKNRAQSLIDQAKRQLDAVGGDGSKLRWEISTQDGANGIRDLFKSGDALDQAPGINQIQIVYEAQ
jgi:TANFOR domain-containing protein